MIMAMTSEEGDLDTGWEGGDGDRGRGLAEGLRRVERVRRGPTALAAGGPRTVSISRCSLNTTGRILSELVWTRRVLISFPAH
jgi:hypothetical protein